MNIFEVIRTALESLAANKLRTALTMLGVIIGVASVVTLLSLGAGVQKFIGSQLETLGTNLINVFPSDIPGARLMMEDAVVLADPKVIPGVVRVVPGVEDIGEVIAGPIKQLYTIAGSPPSFFTQNSVELDQGRWFTNGEEDARARVAVLGASIVERMFPSGNAVGEIITLNGLSFEVIGVAATKGGLSIGIDDTVRIPLSVAAEKLFANRMGGPRSLSVITLETAPGVSYDSVISKVTRVLRQRYHVETDQTDPFTLFVPTTLVSSFNTIATALTAFLGAIGAISLVVGGIGIMNIMLVSVTERTREIGVRKAIGASPGSIRVQFLVEALMVTCLAGVIGVGVGAVAALATGQIQIQEGENFQPQVQASSIAVAFGVSVLIGVIFGLYPAWRASRLQPVEALRYE